MPKKPYDKEMDTMIFDLKMADSFVVVLCKDHHEGPGEYVAYSRVENVDHLMPIAAQLAQAQFHLHRDQACLMDMEDDDE